jgi:hypothetical protein
MRGGIAIVLALALGACADRNIGLLPPPAADASASAAAAAPPPSTGEWKFDRRIDRATGRPVGKAYVVTERVTVRGAKPFARPRPAGLQLQCFKHKPVVLVKFTQKVGASRSARMAYRFDHAPPRDAAARFLPDYKSIAIEDPAAVRQFVADLRGASTLFVSVDSLVAGATRAEFPVGSAETAIATSFADCPLPASAAR